MNEPQSTLKHNWTSGSVAELLGGELLGPTDVPIESIVQIEKRTRHSLSFLANARYKQFLYEGGVRTVLVPQDFTPENDTLAVLIRVDNVYSSLATILSMWKDREEPSHQVHHMALVAQDVVLGETVGVGAFTIIESGSKIGDGTIIGDKVTIGKQVNIGKRCRIYSGVRILDGCSIADRVVIYPNAVIGSEGFGFAQDKMGFRRIPHIGNVVIESDVEIGSNTCIDRGSIGSTFIRKGAKLDNLIQIGHNVEIGAHVAIAAQTGISGSSHIGEGSQLGGQSGVAGHVYIAPHSKIQAQSGVASDLRQQDRKWYGSPAIPYHKFLRSFSWFKKLPQLAKRLDDLERRIKP